MAVDDNLSSAQLRRIKEVSDRILGAGTYDRVNWGQLNVMLRAASQRDGVSQRDRRSAASASDLIASNSF